MLQAVINPNKYLDLFLIKVVQKLLFSIYKPSSLQSNLAKLSSCSDCRYKTQIWQF